MLKASDLRFGEWLGADAHYPGEDLYVERFAPGPIEDAGALLQFQGTIRGQPSALAAQEDMCVTDLLVPDLKLQILYALGDELVNAKDPLMAMTVAEQRILQELSSARMRRIPSGDSAPAEANIQLSFACQLYWMAASITDSLATAPSTDPETCVAAVAFLTAQLCRSYMSGGSGMLSAYYPNYMAAVTGYGSAPVTRLVVSIHRAKATSNPDERSHYSNDPAYRAADTLSEAANVTELDGCHNDFDATSYHSLIGVPVPGAESRLERIGQLWGIADPTPSEALVQNAAPPATTHVALPDIEHQEGAELPSTLRLFSSRTGYTLPETAQTTTKGGRFVSRQSEAASRFRVHLDTSRVLASVYNGPQSRTAFHPDHYHDQARENLLAVHRAAIAEKWSKDSPVLEWRGIVLHQMIRTAANWEIVTGLEARARQLSEAGIRNEERLALMTGAAYNWLAALVLTEDRRRYVSAYRDLVPTEPRTLAEEMPILAEEVDVYILWMLQVSVDQSRYRSPRVSGERKPSEEGFARGPGVRSERLARQFSALLEAVTSLDIVAADIARAVLLFWRQCTHSAFAKTFATADDVNFLLANIIKDPQHRSVRICASRVPDRELHVPMAHACSAAIIQVCRAIVRKRGAKMDATFFGNASSATRPLALADFMHDRRVLDRLLEATRDDQCRALVHAMSTEALVVSAEREVSEAALRVGTRDVRTWQVIFGEAAASYDAFLFFASADTLASARLVTSCMEEAFQRMTHAWQVTPRPGMTEAAQEQWNAFRHLFTDENPLVATAPPPNFGRRPLDYATEKYTVLPAGDSLTVSLGTEASDGSLAVGHVNSNRASTAAAVRQITLTKPTAWLRKSMNETQLEYVQRMERLHIGCDEATTRRALQGVHVWQDVSDLLRVEFTFVHPKSAYKALICWALANSSGSVVELAEFSLQLIPHAATMTTKLFISPSNGLSDTAARIELAGYTFHVACIARFVDRAGRTLGPICKESAQVRIDDTRRVTELYACE